MKMPEKKKTSVFKKFAALFLLMIIPVSVVAIVLYDVQIGTFKQNIIENYRTVINNNLKNVEDEVKEMRTITLESLNDENILKLAGMGSVLSDYERTAAVNRLFYHLKLLKTNGKYMTNMYIYFPELHRVLDANENIYACSFDEVQMQTVKNSIGKYYVEKNKIYQFYSHMGTSFSQDRFNFLIITELDKDMIVDNLMENLPESELSIRDELENLLVQTGNKEGLDEIWNYEAGLEEFGWKMEYRVPIMEIYPEMRKLQIYFIVFIFIFIIVTLFIIQRFYVMIKSPIIRLIDGFYEVETGTLSVRIPVDRRDEFGYLYQSFNSMIANTQNLIEQVYEQENLVKSAKLKQLQSQINPHFLYNSFFVISNMARLSDVESIKKFSEYLAQYYHFIIREEEEESSLAEEVAHSEIYCSIQEIRFGERIKAEIEAIPEKWKEFHIPKLILQPLVENAFEYGLKNKEADGIVKICFEEISGGLQIVVENNGVLAEDELQEMENILDSNNKMSSMGNIHRRLQLRYGKASGLKVTRSGIGGLKVTIVIMQEEKIDV